MILEKVIAERGKYFEEDYSVVRSNVDGISYVACKYYKRRK